MFRTREEGLALAKQVKADKSYVYVLSFFRSDCPHTGPYQAMWKRIFQGMEGGVKYVEVYDQAIHGVRQGLKLSGLTSVPATLVYYKGHKRWFLARHADSVTMERHLESLVAQVKASRSSRRRTGGMEGAGESSPKSPKKEKGPVFFTYYFHRAMRNDPIHLTVIGALTLLQMIRHTPVAYRMVHDLDMHGILQVHSSPSQTYKGNAAARYLSTLLEVNQRLGFVFQHHQDLRRAGGDSASSRPAGADINWADALVGLTVTSALLL